MIYHPEFINLITRIINYYLVGYFKLNLDKNLVMKYFKFFEIFLVSFSILTKFGQFFFQNLHWLSIIYRNNHFKLNKMYKSFNEALKNCHITNIHKCKYFLTAFFVLSFEKLLMGSFFKLTQFIILTILINSNFFRIHFLQFRYC